jgi:UDP-N-acetylmuramyl pentapeptide phosphotransferase/UDP-N-acetylglucosamine-1-phosphate transferase
MAFTDGARTELVFSVIALVCACLGYLVVRNRRTAVVQMERPLL